MKSFSMIFKKFLIFRSLSFDDSYKKDFYKKILWKVFRLTYWTEKVGKIEQEPMYSDVYLHTRMAPPPTFFVVTKLCGQHTV